MSGLVPYLLQWVAACGMGVAVLAALARAYAAGRRRAEAEWLTWSALVLPPSDHLPPDPPDESHRTPSDRPS